MFASISWFRTALVLAALVLSDAALAGGHFPEETFMNMMGRSKPEPPPFALPESLPGGGVKKFHRAVSNRSYEYSQGGLVIVYQYEDLEMAAEDFTAFAKAAEKLDEKTAAPLAAQGACVAHQKDTDTLWFLLDQSVVGFQLPHERWSTPAVVKSAEELVKAEMERRAKLFGEPEKLLATYLKSVEKVDEQQILQCLAATDDDSRQHLRTLKMMLPLARAELMQNEMRNRGGLGQAGQNLKPKVGKAEKADGRVFVPVRLNENDSDHIWFELLKFAAVGEEGEMMPPGMAGQGEPLWIPVTQTRGRWAIDLRTLRLSGFTKVVQTQQDRDCFSNLRQILLGLKAFAIDDANQNFPEKLSNLIANEYVKDLNVFCGPGSATKIKDETEVDEKSDYIYEGKGKQDDGDGDTILIYDKPGLHQNKGRHVGFVDGHVQWIAEEEFQKQLAAQRAGKKIQQPPNRDRPVPPPLPMPPDAVESAPAQIEPAMPQAVPGQAPPGMPRRR